MRHYLTNTASLDQQPGHFSADGNAYEITTARPPRPWNNYLWNKEYVSIFSHLAQGESFSQDAMGRRIPLVAARMCFLYDVVYGSCWSANALPDPQASEDFRCIHGRGDSVIESTRHGVKTSFRCFVPEQGRQEIWTLRIENLSERDRHLSVMPMVDTLMDGYDKPQAYYMSSGTFLEELGAVVLQNRVDFEGANPFAYNYLLCNAAVDGFDTAQRDLFGTGTWQRPDAVFQGQLTNSKAEMEKPLLAISVPVTVPAGESVVLQIVVGTALSRDEISEVKLRYMSDVAVEKAHARMMEAIDVDLTGPRFKTPFSDLDVFASQWLPRQISLGARWARVRHNGFRDMVQDIGAMVSWNPESAWVHLQRILSFQHADGHAPRTWLDGKILDKDFSDNHVWIAYTVHQLIMETGDLALLDLEIPFNDGSSASLYEHVKRAVNYLWEDRAQFGLCKIRSGDWNDCMDLTGPKGKGVSIWLSQAWVLANQQFADLARASGRGEDATLAEERGKEMKHNLNTHGWDGRYYVRAFSDTGDVLGSHLNQQGTLFLNTQTWAVLSGSAPAERALQILEESERLLESDIGIRCVKDAYACFDPTVGLMSLKKPGVQENGGVYLHTCTFKLIADCMLKRADAVEKLLLNILPFRQHEVYPRDGEPYVFCNGYYALEGSPRYGKCGQSWGTGTAGWFYTGLLNHVFGLQPEWAGLRVNPCLPPSWTECAVTRKFRETTYEVSYERQGPGTDCRVEIDGQVVENKLLPLAKGQRIEVKVIVS
ncbi:hypothetical protein P3T73_06550 [Kiritimatiellota bacterium B12222]|nr:hypothetical protein P3T73_06550 [Kiritimatiellota bacterium B12222]